MNYPLNIHILWHPNNREGYHYGKAIFSAFSRDVKYPLRRGLGIPTYFISTPKNLINKIDWNGAVQTCIFFLIDEHMVIDEDELKWEPEILRVYNHCKKNSKTTLFYPIKMHENANRFSIKLNTLNSGNLYKFRENEQLGELLIQLAFQLSVRLYSTPNNEGELPITLFISHTKQDQDDLTYQIKEVIDKLRLELTSFIKVRDLSNGDDFEKEFRHKTRASILLILNTDKYSSDERCIRGVLDAKKNSCPIIEVNASKTINRRVFPYLGNIPSIRLRITETGKNNVREIITMVLLETLNFKYHEKLNKLIVENTPITQAIIPCVSSALPPELLTLPQGEGKQLFLYPSPPLGKAEISMLNLFKPNIDFVTPLLYMIQNSFGTGLNNKFLKNRIVGISISGNSDLTEVKNVYNLFDRIHLEDALVNISRYMLICGAQLSYGGDINYSEELNFTEILMNLIASYIDEYESPFYPVINHVFYPITEIVKGEYDLRSKCKGMIDFKFYDNPLREPFSELEKDKSSVSLTYMRKQMFQNNEGQIFIGGKLKNHKRITLGMLEEAYWALKYKRPIYIIGAFGGACGELVKLLVDGNSDVLKGYLDDTSNNENWEDDYSQYKVHAQELWKETSKEVDERVLYEPLRDFFRNYWIQNDYNLNNGLSQEDNITLFKSKNILEINRLILKGLNATFNT